MTSASVSLPADLAPALRERALELLSQLTPAPAHPDLREGGRFEHRCYVCRERGGRVSGHHEGGQIVWVHRACHRRLHRRRTATGRQIR